MSADRPHIIVLHRWRDTHAHYADYLDHDTAVYASLEDVKGFFKTWYVPANATLSVSGDFDVAQARQPG